MFALLLPECRCTLVKHSCTIRNMAISISCESRCKLWASRSGMTCLHSRWSSVERMQTVSEVPVKRHDPALLFPATAHQKKAVNKKDRVICGVLLNRDAPLPSRHGWLHFVFV